MKGNLDKIASKPIKAVLSSKWSQYPPQKSPKQSLYEKYDSYPLFKMAAAQNREHV